MFITDLPFTLEQMTDFLSRRGLEVRRTKARYMFEALEHEVHGVFKDGEPYKKPKYWHGYYQNNEEMAWVAGVFYEELTKTLSAL